MNHLRARAVNLSLISSISVNTMKMVVPRSTQHFIFLSLVRLEPGTPGDLMFKSKLSPRSGFAVLKCLNPLHKSEP